jgi:hypothetical protein
MQFIMVANAFEVGGYHDGMRDTFLHSTFDLGAEAVRLSQRDVIREKKMNIDVVNLPGIAMAQRMESNATPSSLTSQRFIQKPCQLGIGMIHETRHALPQQAIA